MLLRRGRHHSSNSSIHRLLCLPVFRARDEYGKVAAQDPLSELALLPAATCIQMITHLIPGRKALLTRRHLREHSLLCDRCSGTSPRAPAPTRHGAASPPKSSTAYKPHLQPARFGRVCSSRIPRTLGCFSSHPGRGCSAAGHGPGAGSCSRSPQPRCWRWGVGNGAVTAGSRSSHGFAERGGTTPRQLPYCCQRTFAPGAPEKQSRALSDDSLSRQPALNPEGWHRCHRPHAG